MVKPTMILMMSSGLMFCEADSLFSGCWVEDARLDDVRTHMRLAVAMGSSKTTSF